MFRQIVGSWFKIAILALLVGFLWLGYDYTHQESVEVVQVEAVQEDVPLEIHQYEDYENGFVCYATENNLNCAPWYYGLAPWEAPSPRPTGIRGY
jgi:hypothetical protein|tara:strand:+ start:1020 stop:1304 length:285 start_codon:yes stop_codon:yes gene_type:complete